MKTVLKIALGICLAFTLMIGGCVALIGASANSVSNEMEKQEQQEHKKQKAAPVGKVGKSLTNAGTTYKVTSAKATSTIGDNEYTRETTSGTFVVVGLELTNNKDETKTFMEANAKLRTKDGKEYETSSKGIMALDADDSLVMEEIQPDLTTSGKLVFELPKSKTSGAQLVIEDLWGNGSVKFALGL
jgi:hypothetical protein